MADLVKVSAPAIVREPASLQAGSAEIYSRIARGARRCWFGPGGRIAASHIFHADVASSVDGGAVEIVVHERATDQPKPWGYKAYRISLGEQPRLDGAPGGANATLNVENLRMPPDEASRMRAEVFAWAGGDQSCSEAANGQADILPAPVASSGRKAAATPPVRGKAKSGRGGAGAAKRNAKRLANEPDGTAANKK